MLCGTVGAVCRKLQSQSDSRLLSFFDFLPSFIFPISAVTHCFSFAVSLYFLARTRHAIGMRETISQTVHSVHRADESHGVEDGAVAYESGRTTKNATCSVYVAHESTHTHIHIHPTCIRSSLFRIVHTDNGDVVRCIHTNARTQSARQPSSHTTLHPFAPKQQQSHRQL